MKTRIKYLLIMGAITLTQSCNMSRHYANMRINHCNEIVQEKQVPMVKASTNKTLPVISKTDSCMTIPIIGTEKQVELTDAPAQKNSLTTELATEKKETRKTFYVYVKKKNIFSVHKAKKMILKQNFYEAKSKPDLGGLLADLGWMLVTAVLVVVIVLTWEFLAAFWIALGAIFLVVLGIVIGFAIIIGGLLKIIFEGR
ncbi:MAG TPA: hypothetical protein VK177_01970 [Flavobacteriales bacterium]|nr:hypothetical protein [Flavobacteriales bacterium]